MDQRSWYYQLKQITGLNCHQSDGDIEYMYMYVGYWSPIFYQSNDDGN